jgi:hypothetical protein
MDAASLSGLPEEEVLQTINSALTRSGKRVEELTAVEPTEDLEAMFPDEDEVNE